MARNEIHVGDTGLVIQREIRDQDNTVVNLSTATAKQFYFQKPDGTDATVTASFTTNGTDGLIQYTSLAATFDQEGIWQAQAIITFPTSAPLHSDVWEFEVFPNLQ